MQELEVLISSNLFSFLDFASRNLVMVLVDCVNAEWTFIFSDEMSKGDCTIPAPSENMSSIGM